MLKILFRPFAYLSIQHSDRVYIWVNWYIPIFFSSITIGFWLIPSLLDFLGFIKPQPIDIWGSSGLISKLQNFVQNLPGFYTAALAAVATFGSRNMLKVMPGKAPTMRFLVEGKMTNGLPLNRRLFISSMFAYLTALSFLLAIGASVATSIAPAFKSLLMPTAVPFASAMATGIFTLFFIQMLTITGWGLYYLGEKIHLNDGPESIE
jgi:hypothetical protein